MLASHNLSSPTPEGTNEINLSWWAGSVGRMTFFFRSNFFPGRLFFLAGPGSVRGEARVELPVECFSAV